LRQINQYLQRMDRRLDRQDARTENARIIMSNRLVGFEMGLRPRLKEVIIPPFLCCCPVT
jgi:hypothetical protein